MKRNKKNKWDTKTIETIEPQQDESLELGTSEPDTITPEDYEPLELPELESEDLTMPEHLATPEQMLEPLEVQYNDSMPERAEYLSEFSMLDKGLAIAFGVSVDKIRSWKCSHRPFSEAIKRGKKSFWLQPRGIYIEKLLDSTMLKNGPS